jgi:hypothetical protein
VLKRGLLEVVWGQSASISYGAERWDLTAYPRPYLVAIGSSTVVSRRPSTCREPGRFVFVAVNCVMDRLESGIVRSVDVAVIMVRSCALRSSMRRQWQMSICCWDIGNRGASKALLPPCEVRESARRADPVPRASERVGISTGSPYAFLQAVVIHGQGVGAVEARGVGFAGLSG